MPHNSVNIFRELGEELENGHIGKYDQQIVKFRCLTRTEAAGAT